MVEFDGKIVQFGFGAVGKSFFEMVSKEIKFNKNNYFVINRDQDDFDAFVEHGGVAANFFSCEITRENFHVEFRRFLASGDLLLDFTDSIGTKDICDWCANNNIMYINTGNADWPEDWYSIYEVTKSLYEVKAKHHDSPQTNKYPIVLQHGNNPGLVSHFLKAGIEYIARTQHSQDRRLEALIMQGRFNEAAQILGIRIIHVNDYDMQESDIPYNTATLINTWCIDSFLFEILSEAAFHFGSHEEIDNKNECKIIDQTFGYIELAELAIEKKSRTYFPGGMFEGFIVPHEETYTIAKSLEIKQGDKIIYRPSVVFVYLPCRLATEYTINAMVDEYPEPNTNKPADSKNEKIKTSINGYKYPKKTKILGIEDITSGTEYVGVLIIGENFDPVWIGNRVELSYLKKAHNKACRQTPTITPVAATALAAACWVIKNKDKRGIYFPDDIPDYNYIIELAEKYISETIYKTFTKETLGEALKIDFSNLKTKDFFVV